MPEQLHLGIDGGGRKTAGVLLDDAGRQIAARLAGGAAIVGEPSPAALKVLGEVVEDLCRQAGAGRDAVAFCGIGLNGVDFDEEVPMQREAVAEAVGLPPDKIALVNDGIAALWGATGAEAAAVVQHGSGITSAYRASHGGETLFDNLNVGKVFDIRWEAPAVVARMLDGRLEPTPLKDKLLAFLGIPAEEFAETVFRRRFDWQRYMSTAPLIFEAYEQGDAGAELLVERAIEDYAQAAAAMVRRTGREDAEAAFGGGTLEPAGERFWRRLRERMAALAPAAKVIRPLLAPQYGAAIMAAFCAGRDAADFYDKVFGACRDKA